MHIAYKSYNCHMTLINCIENCEPSWLNWEVHMPLCSVHGSTKVLWQIHQFKTNIIHTMCEEKSASLIELIVVYRLKKNYIR